MCSNILYALNYSTIFKSDRFGEWNLVPKKINNTRNQVTTHTHTYRTKKTLILLEINKKILDNVEKYSFSVKKFDF